MVCGWDGETAADSPTLGLHAARGTELNANKRQLTIHVDDKSSFLRATHPLLGLHAVEVGRQTWQQELQLPQALSNLQLAQPDARRAL